MRKGQLLLLLANVALCVGWIAQFRPTWSDGN